MPKKILIVDDEPLIVKGLKYSLEQDGYETDSAQDGEEAVNKFFAGQYDLVLLDVMLPKLDGLEVARRLRSGSKRVDQRRSVSVDAGAAVENQNLL